MMTGDFFKPTSHHLQVSCFISHAVPGDEKPWYKALGTFAVCAEAPARGDRPAGRGCTGRGSSCCGCFPALHAGHVSSRSPRRVLGHIPSSRAVASTGLPAWCNPARLQGRGNHRLRGCTALPTSHRRKAGRPRSGSSRDRALRRYARLEDRTRTRLPGGSARAAPPGRDTCCREKRHDAQSNTWQQLWWKGRGFFKKQKFKNPQQLCLPSLTAGRHCGVSCYRPPPPRGPCSWTSKQPGWYRTG